MRFGKWIALVIIVLLGWQHQEMVRRHASVLRHLVPISETYLEMRDYREALNAHLREHRNMLPLNLEPWLMQRFERKGTKPPTEDFFGTPYEVLYYGEKGLILRSCGPDTTCDTDDDLVLELKGR